KSDRMMADLSNYFLKSDNYNEYTTKLSASSLISYIACPLKFYFRYIAKIREQEETEENIEAATFGKILHRSMQLLYGENMNLTETVFHQLPAKIKNVVDHAIREEFHGHELEGKNILIRNVIVELVQKILDIDKKDAPVTI